MALRTGLPAGELACAAPLSTCGLCGAVQGVAVGAGETSPPCTYSYCFPNQTPLCGIKMPLRIGVTICAQRPPWSAEF